MLTQNSFNWHYVTVTLSLPYSFSSQIDLGVSPTLPLARKFSHCCLFCCFSSFSVSNFIYHPIYHSFSPLQTPSFLSHTHHSLSIISAHSEWSCAYEAVDFY
ncbi:unnamed protein product [Calicophoron daubneyi]|uniref:Uncharacterized protein n=1 Tax=Calicophoron daubneyi TaxID=300641 RepID=A0AAV2SYP4_CALDB